jgi:hypothetical protein
MRSARRRGIMSGSSVVPDHGRVVLRPLLMTRLANTVPGIVLAALGWPLAEVLAASMWLAGLPAVVAAGVVVAVRGYRMSVVITNEHVIVRGLLRSRTIRRADVVALTALPCLRWRRPSGRYAYTPLIMFMEAGPMLPAVQAHNQVCVARLSRTLRRRQ